MDEAERLTLEAELQERLAKEHEERVAKTGQRPKRASPRSEELERMIVAKEMRERFYRENGYVEYKNSRGEVEWLLPEEAERRQQSRERRKRKHKRRRSGSAPSDTERFSLTTWALIAGAALTLSFLLGFFLLRG